MEHAPLNNSNHINKINECLVLYFCLLFVIIVEVSNFRKREIHFSGRTPFSNKMPTFSGRKIIPVPF